MPSKNRPLLFLLFSSLALGWVVWLQGCSLGAAPQATTPQATTPQATTPQATTPQATTPQAASEKTTRTMGNPRMYYTVEPSVVPFAESEGARQWVLSLGVPEQSATLGWVQGVGFWKCSSPFSGSNLASLCVDDQGHLLEVNPPGWRPGRAPSQGFESRQTGLGPLMVLISQSYVDREEMPFSASPLPSWVWYQAGQPPAQVLLTGRRQMPTKKAKVKPHRGSGNKYMMQLGKVELCYDPKTCDTVWVMLDRPHVLPWIHLEPLPSTLASGQTRYNPESMFDLARRFAEHVLTMLARNFNASFALDEQLSLLELSKGLAYNIHPEGDKGDGVNQHGPKWHGERSTRSMNLSKMAMLYEDEETRDERYNQREQRCHGHAHRLLLQLEAARHVALSSEILGIGESSTTEINPQELTRRFNLKVTDGLKEMAAISDPEARELSLSFLSDASLWLWSAVAMECSSIMGQSLEPDRNALEDSINAALKKVKDHYLAQITQHHGVSSTTNPQNLDAQLQQKYNVISWFNVVEGNLRKFLHEN